MRSSSFCLVGALLLACGGTTVTISDGGADSGSGSGSGGGSSGSSSGSSSGGSSSGGSSSGGSSGSSGGSSGSSGGSSGGSGGSSSSGGGSGGSSGGSSSGSSSGGGPTCNDMLNQINQLRPGAEVCCPTCNHAPCTFVVEDLCCPLTVDMQGSNGVVAFENAVQQFKLSKCVYGCPAVPCPVAPSNTCDPGTSMCKE